MGLARPGLTPMFLDLSGRRAVVIDVYDRPYSDPIAVKAGDAVKPDAARKTELSGWIWCEGPDGRSGWTPAQWLGRMSDGWFIKRDFSAIELDLRPGDRLILFYSESGFVWARTEDGREGWAPHGVLQIYL